MVQSHEAPAWKGRILRHKINFFVLGTFQKEDIRKTLAGRWKLVKGAEPSQFNWSVLKKPRKLPAVRVPAAIVTTQEESCEVEEQFFGQEVEPSVSTVNTASSSPAREESDVLKLQWEIEQLKVELADFKQKLIEVEKEREILLARQFSLDKIKDDDSAVLFYTGFPNYAALIGFYNFIESKLKKMQYWKGEKLFKESQPYQMEDIRKKNLDLQENFHTWMNFYLLL